MGHLKLIKLFLLNFHLAFTPFMVPQMHLNLVGMAKTDNRTHKWFILYFSLSNFPGKTGFSSNDSRSMAQFLRELKWTNQIHLSFTKTNYRKLLGSFLVSAEAKANKKQKPKQTNKRTFLEWSIADQCFTTDQFNGQNVSNSIFTEETAFA